MGLNSWVTEITGTELENSSNMAAGASGSSGVEGGGGGGNVRGAFFGGGETA